jgi:hypothetical protein
MSFFDNLSEFDLVKLREYINEVHLYNDEIKKQQEETKENPLYCRSKLINSVESNRFYVYDSIDSVSFNKRYILTLLTVRLDGTKFTFNISIDSVFFDIKLHSDEDAFNHIMEFDPDSYETMIKQPFDSTEKHNFLRLHFTNQKKRKEALKKINIKRDELILKLKNNISCNFSSIEEFDHYYDTYSDNETCYYRKVASENDFELVGWYEIDVENIQNNMVITFDDIKKLDFYEIPSLLLLY